MISLFYQAAQAIAGVFLFTLGLVQKNSPSVLLYTLPSILVKTNKNALFWGDLSKLLKLFLFGKNFFHAFNNLCVLLLQFVVCGMLSFAAGKFPNMHVVSNLI